MQDNSTASQRGRFLKHLQNYGSGTTIFCRHSLDIMHPAARCQELRRRGYPIDTVWVADRTPEGHVHRVAKYVLLPRKQLTLDDFLPGKEEGKS